MSVLKLIERELERIEHVVVDDVKVMLKAPADFRVRQKIMRLAGKATTTDQGEGAAALVEAAVLAVKHTVHEAALDEEQAAALIRAAGGEGSELVTRAFALCGLRNEADRKDADESPIE